MQYTEQIRNSRKLVVFEDGTLSVQSYYTTDGWDSDTECDPPNLLQRLRKDVPGQR